MGFGIALAVRKAAVGIVRVAADIDPAVHKVEQVAPVVRKAARIVEGSPVARKVERVVAHKAERVVAHKAEWVARKVVKVAPLVVAPLAVVRKAALAVRKAEQVAPSVEHKVEQVVAPLVVAPLVVAPMADHKVADMIQAVRFEQVEQAVGLENHYVQVQKLESQFWELCQAQGLC